MDANCDGRLLDKEKYNEKNTDELLLLLQEKESLNSQLIIDNSLLKNEIGALTISVSGCSEKIFELSEKIKDLLQQNKILNEMVFDLQKQDNNINKNVSNPTCSVVKSVQFKNVKNKSKRKADETNDESNGIKRINSYVSLNSEMIIDDDNAVSDNSIAMNPETSEVVDPDHANTSDVCASNDNDNTEKDWAFVNFKNQKDNKIKIPPIQVFFSKGSMNVVRLLLSRQIGFNKFTMTPRNDGGGARIFSATLLQHKEIIKVLEKNKFEFHTYLTTNQKKKCYIIRGINTHFGFNADEIHHELTKAGLPDDIVIKTFATAFMKAQGDMALFKLIVPPNFDDSTLRKISAILGVGIKFELFHSGPVTQCSNCQHFFHTASACFRKYRCVKCTKEHLPGECAKLISEEPQCINCGGLHTANNLSNCSYFKDKIQPIVVKKNANQKSSDLKNNVNVTINSTVKEPNIFKNKHSINNNSWSKTVSNHNSNSSHFNLESKFDKFCDSIMLIIENQNKIINSFFNDK